jgi:hydrogenase nickel incorporation protein HypA/HybF
MHEASLMANLIHQITRMAHQHQATKVTGVHVKLGVLSHLSPAHFHEHFVRAARGTIADGAQLTIETSTDIRDAHAQEIRLDSIEVED